MRSRVKSTAERTQAPQTLPDGRRAVPADRPFGRQASWPAFGPGPVATAAQRARRRRPGLPSARTLVLSPRPADAPLAETLEDLGFQPELTDSGAVAIYEAAAGDLALCVIDIGGEAGSGLEYVACLNQIDPLLPVIVLNDRDDLEVQRKVRSHRVFFYLVEPVDRDVLRAVIDAAAMERFRRPA